MNEEETHLSTASTACDLVWHREEASSRREIHIERSLVLQVGLVEEAADLWYS
jgi:hypothetical protein